MKQRRNKRILTIGLSLTLVVTSFSFMGFKHGWEEVEAVSAHQQDSGSSDSGIFLNVDLNSVTFPFLNTVTQKAVVKEEDLYPFVDQYVNTQITDIAFNVYTQVSATRSSVMTDLVARCQVTEINGTAVDFFQATEGTHSLRGIYDIDQVHGIDPYAVWFCRAREQGLNAWLSVRMNDCHDPDNYYSWLHGDLFYEALQKGWVVGSSYGYYRYCLDYAVPEVRERMLAYIEEQLLRYDVDGLELDFSREWICFSHDGKDHVAIMNQFLRDVQAVVHVAAQQWGHDIKINIRLMRDIEQNKAYGFDAETMVNEKLVDSITVCPRWATCDSDMPIDTWKARFPSMAIYAGVTDQIYNTKSQLSALTGYAAQYLNQGADKIYFFNLFNNPLAPNADYQKLYTICGSLATLSNVIQRYVVTYQDMAPSGYPAWQPLPARANGFQLSVATGPIADKDAVWLIVGVDRELSPGDLTLTVNGKTAAFQGETTYAADYAGRASQVYFYTIPGSECQELRQSVVITAKSNSLTLQYLEMTVGLRQPMTNEELYASEDWVTLHRWDFEGNLKDSVGGAVAQKGTTSYFREPTYRDGRIVLDGYQVYTFDEALTFPFTDTLSGLRIDVKAKMDFTVLQGAHRIFGNHTEGQRTAGLNYINIAGAQYGSCSFALSTTSAAWNSFVLIPEAGAFDTGAENLYTFLFHDNTLCYYVNGVPIAAAPNAAGGQFRFNDFLGCSYVEKAIANNFVGEIDSITITMLSSTGKATLPESSDTTAKESETPPTTSKAPETEPKPPVTTTREPATALPMPEPLITTLPVTDSVPSESPPPESESELPETATPTVRESNPPETTVSMERDTAFPDNETAANTGMTVAPEMTDGETGAEPMKTAGLPLVAAVLIVGVAGLVGVIQYQKSKK